MPILFKLLLIFIRYIIYLLFCSVVNYVLSLTSSSYEVLAFLPTILFSSTCSNPCQIASFLQSYSANSLKSQSFQVNCAPLSISFFSFVFASDSLFDVELIAFSNSESLNFSKQSSKFSSLTSDDDIKFFFWGCSSLTL